MFGRVCGAEALQPRDGLRGWGGWRALRFSGAEVRTTGSAMCAVAQGCFYCGGCMSSGAHLRQRNVCGSTGVTAIVDAVAGVYIKLSHLGLGVMAWLVCWFVIEQGCTGIR
eukprot:1156120-Pelagomonas_calceolata.AAC.3